DGARHAHDVVVAVGDGGLAHHEGHGPGLARLLVDVGDTAPAEMVRPGRMGLKCSNSCSPCRMRPMSTPRSWSSVSVPARSLRQVTGKVGGAMMSPHGDARPTSSSR